MNNERTIFAPVALFVYNRLSHTKQVINSLKNNKLCSSTDLIIFSDGPKDDSDKNRVNEIRSYLKKIDGFRSIKIIEKEKNIGLAKSIIDGVSDVIKTYGKIIVLEDDIEVSKDFLEYMNHSLNFYKEKKKVWHINSWSLGIEDPSINDYFFVWQMSCWGWGTWEDRWNHFKKDPDQIISNWSKKEIYEFNLDGSQNYFNQIRLNHKEKIDTWAVFWGATIFNNKGLSFTPRSPFSKNIGFDGSGVHCDSYDPWSPQVKEFKKNNTYIFPEIIEENKIAAYKIKEFYRKNFFKKIISKFQNLIKNFKL